MSSTPAKLARLVPGLAASLLLGAASPAGVSVADAWFRMITPQVPAGGYFTLHNASTSPATLDGASSSACGMMTLHRTRGDAMAMVHTVTIPPGGTLAFAPGGYHLMCMQPRMTLGQTAPLTLHFAGGDSLETRAPVLGARDQPPHSGS